MEEISRLLLDIRCGVLVLNDKVDYNVSCPFVDIVHYHQEKMRIMVREAELIRIIFTGLLYTMGQLKPDEYVSTVDNMLIYGKMAVPTYEEYCDMYKSRSVTEVQRQGTEKIDPVDRLRELREKKGNVEAAIRGKLGGNAGKFIEFEESKVDHILMKRVQKIFSYLLKPMEKA